MEVYLDKLLGPKLSQKIVTAAKKYENPDKVIFEALGQYSSDPNSQFLCDLEAGRLNWSSVFYTNFYDVRKHTDHLIECPPELTNSDEPCVRCGQFKVIVVSQQTRSADEGLTYKRKCFNSRCKYVQVL